MNNQACFDCFVDDVLKQGKSWSRVNPVQTSILSRWKFREKASAGESSVERQSDSNSVKDPVYLEGAVE